MLGKALLVGLLALAAGSPAAAPGTTTVAFGEPSTLCRTSDPRLAGLSGITEGASGLLGISDRERDVFAIDGDCAPTPTLTLPDTIAPTDLEDLASSPDGTLWISDSGGNRAPREEVAIYRWVPGEPAPTVIRLSYPDGPHDAEALLVDMRGVPVLVTKEPSGTSGVYTTLQRPDPSTVTPLSRVGALDVASWGLADASAPGSLLVTGGAVSPTGVQVVLRTYTAAYEWDAPDGDVVAALTGRAPDRSLDLPSSPQGEAITYGQAGRRLVTASEQIGSPVATISIDRRPVPSEAAPVERESYPQLLVAGGIAAVAALGVALVTILRWRRAW